jgi:hypothetical protein
MEINPLKAIEFIQINAEVYAQAKADRLYIEGYLKYLKASLMNESDSSSLGAKEQYAYSNDRYLEQLQAMKVATEGEERLKYLMEAAKMKVEVWKTQEYTKRTEMKM